MPFICSTRGNFQGKKNKVAAFEKRDTALESDKNCPSLNRNGGYISTS